jgi:hypothetical protein
MDEAAAGDGSRAPRLNDRPAGESIGIPGAYLLHERLCLHPGPATPPHLWLPSRTRHDEGGK